tara:strand:- start:94 stop:336 length:243 start_codon:yes stop_codon:yes gene_type:complete
MAGPSKKIEISYELSSNGNFVRRIQDLKISSHGLVTSKGSTLKGYIVNLLAVHSQPLDLQYVAFEDPPTKKYNKYGYTNV